MRSTPLMRRDYPRPGGALRRLIDLQRNNVGTVAAWIEDDFHHFGVTVSHDGAVVTDVTATTLRAPWSTCPGAALPLRTLIGKPLIERASAVGTLLNMRQQCTHMFDLAGLALAHAWHGREHRSYEVVVPDRRLKRIEGRNFEFDLARCTLWRDGEVVMEWDVEEPLVIGPEPFGGQSLNRGFREWTDALPIEAAEQAFVLRRAIMVAAGRTMDLDALDKPDGAMMGGMCHTYGLPDLTKVVRSKGSSRNFEQGREGMLANLQAPPVINPGQDQRSTSVPASSTNSRAEARSRPNGE
ncbi:hypothetical protein GGQ88_002185 [Novosphingobium hassiacum]|uniref:DUF2889 domain-containing protein n=1 Tax=Novosphingobium hassiacum TaxID=173676 RepID=A0A7W5ZVX9_9SPHN|nr:hypothetical protein [Novosphingobium hassiacum]